MDLYRREVQDVIWDDRWKAQRQIVNHSGGYLAQVQGKWLLKTTPVRTGEATAQYSFAQEDLTKLTLPDHVFEQCNIQFRLVRHQELELDREHVEFLGSYPDGSVYKVCNDYERKLRYECAAMKAHATTWVLAAAAALSCGGKWQNGSSGGQAGLAGAGGATGTGGAAGGTGGALLAGCPKGLPGPELVSVETPGAWYCIDSTEVSNADYAIFLADGPALLGQPSECSMNQTWYSGAGAVPSDLQPVRFVDWCDAWAYCHWAGKRLCGRRGGGALGFDDFSNIDESEWYFACTRGGERDYPYPGAFQPKMCGGKGSNLPLKDVDDGNGCEGGIVGLFCMSGNVAEWEDACSSSSTDAACRVRGGAFDSSSTELRCDGDASAMRTAALATIGIRCCADSTPL